MTVMPNLSYRSMQNTHSSEGSETESSRTSPLPRDLRFNSAPSGSTNNLVLSKLLFNFSPILAQKNGFKTKISKRIDELKEMASEEGLDVNERSETNLVRFLRRSRIKNIPSIYLLDNGNYRAVWSNKDGRQVAAQFRPDSAVQYVIFGAQSEEFISRSAGRTRIDTFRELVLLNGVRDLLGI